MVHFVRHGEGFHNIGIVNEDAHLTEAGWRQAAALKKHIAGLTPALDIQVRIFARKVIALLAAMDSAAVKHPRHPCIVAPIAWRGSTSQILDQQV